MKTIYSLPGAAASPSRYESQKRRDWNTFGQYLKNQRPPVALSQCNCNHVLEFLRYLDQFGKTKVHLQGCMFYGQPEPPAPCTCPLRQAWGSLDALIGRLRAAYEENGGPPETNPFASSAIRVYLREDLVEVHVVGESRTGRKLLKGIVNIFEVAVYFFAVNCVYDAWYRHRDGADDLLKYLL
ncbi:hypothetical protein GH714_033815 [Hevea brasiliensis]|uniref:ALOG domain-containing protein n=1 Tax=Hevea brasiliensis TaxID=3981 RepID=A0A6A6LLB5_HEVBR|nr:hypothetical protein GH714_033815 [Hevea brasiliensis]